MKYITLQKKLDKLNNDNWDNQQLPLSWQQGFNSAIKDIKAFHSTLKNIVNFINLVRDCNTMIYNTSNIVPQTDYQRGFMYALSHILRYITIDKKPEYTAYLQEYSW
jgi:hypothetical protein